MQSKYPFFKYVTGESKFHMMNSKNKIAWFLLTLLAILLLRTHPSLAVIGFYVVIMMSLTKINIEAYLCNVALLWPFLVTVMVITFMMSFNISLSILISMKLVLVMMVFLILTFTTSLSEIAWGFECLFGFLKRFKVPVSRFSLKIALGIKFVATLFEQYRSVRKSMAYRGVPYKVGMYKTFKNMLIPVIRISYKLSSRMGAAMKLRFYGCSKQRTNYHENKVTNFDRFLIWTSILIVYVSLSLGWF